MADSVSDFQSQAPMEEDITGLPYQPPGDEDSFNMNHQKRGKAVIFCHEKFTLQDGVTKCPELERHGASEDKKQLLKTLKAMGWDDNDIIVRDDQPRTGIMNTMQELKDADHSNADCVLVVVLTHGKEEGWLFDSESNEYNESELWEPFVGVQSLVGKPKILIKQACRGGKFDMGNTIRGDSLKVPEQADFLIYRSTPENYSAWRNEKNGSVFIRCLCEVLEETVCRGDYSKDLLTLFTRVNRKVAKIDIEVKIENKKESVKQIPEICSRLTKDLYFNKK